MTVYKEFKTGGNNSNPFGGIASIVMLVIGLLLAYLVIKGIFTLLFWLFPILLIAGIAIDPKEALKFGKSLITLSKKNPLIPLAVIVLSALWFPVIPGTIAALAGGFLLTKALVKKKIKKVFDQGIPGQEESEEFVEYEEVTEDESFLELPEITKEQKSQKSGNEYDNLFE